MEKIFEIYIRTTPERLWAAITDPQIRAKYHFGAGVSSDWTPGSGVQLAHPRRHVRSPRARCWWSTRPAGWCRRMRALWGEDATGRGTSRVTWDIEPVADSCRLTVTHDQLREDATPAVRRLADDPVRPEDLAGDRRAADHARLADVRLTLFPCRGGPEHAHRPAIRRSTRSASPSPTRTGRWPSIRRVLGFNKRLDAPIGPARRWIMVGAPRGTATIALVAASPAVPAGVETGIRLTSRDVDADHEALRAAGVDAGDVLRWPGVPPMFAFRDPDGNGLEIIEASVMSGPDRGRAGRAGQELYRHAGEVARPGRLDLPGDARVGRVLRHPGAGQGDRHDRRAPVPQLVHGARRRHPQAAGQPNCGPRSASARATRSACTSPNG